MARLFIMPPAKFGQRPPRLIQVFQRYDNPVYFVTFCVHRRASSLANEDVHSAFITFANRALHEFNIAVGRYVLMPDHVHLFVCGGDDFLLGRWIGTLKQALSRGISRSKPTTQVWQEGFFDHVLRNDESMSQKWEYIRQNPVRAGLVERSEDWPYQGKIVPIDRA
jgi:putative transposase